MSYKISVNTNEGAIVASRKICCASPLERLKLCTCGEISALGGSCRACGAAEKQRRPLMRATKAAFRKKKARELRGQLVLLVLTVILLAAYRFFMRYVVEPAGQSDALSGLHQIIVNGTGVLIVAVLVLETVFLVLSLIDRFSSSRSYGDQVFSIYELATQPADFVLENQTKPKPWKKLLLNGVQRDIRYLNSLYRRLSEKGDSVQCESYEALYQAALELSYFYDTKSLAALRLRCLAQIKLMPNAQTDLEQILQIIPMDELVCDREFIYTIQTCVVNCNTTLSQATVARLFQFMVEISGLHDKTVCAIMEACGPAYLVPLLKASNIRRMMENFSAVKKRNPVFRLLAERAESGKAEGTGGDGAV